MLEVTSFGSGSSGNALLVRTPGAVLLVDCGVGARQLSKGLGPYGLSFSDIDAVLVSHEHVDHIRELPRFIRTGTVVLSSEGTAAAARVPSRTWHEVSAERPACVGDVEIAAIPVAHDAVEPCGFLIRSAGGTLTVLTDLGSPSPSAAEAIQESNLVVLEANHDEAMVRSGPYPPHLQRRILSDTGHLSNRACGELLVAALRHTRQLPTIWLAHLSATNNRPHLAKQTVERRLAQSGLRLDLYALPRRDVSDVWRPETARVGMAQLPLEFLLG